MNYIKVVDVRMNGIQIWRLVLMLESLYDFDY